MIVGISGKKQSGKNTVALIWQYLYDYYQAKYTHPITKEDFKSYVYNKHHLKCIWEQKSFAYKIKQIVCILIGCTMEQLEDPVFKETPLGEEWWCWKIVLDGGYGTHLYPYSLPKPRNIQGLNLIKTTPRMLMQMLGTEFGRDMVHPNLWVTALFSNYKPIIVQESEEKTSSDGGYYSIPNIKEYPNWLISDVRFFNEAKAIKDRGGILIRVDRDSDYKDSHVSENGLDTYKDWNYVIDNNYSLAELMLRVRQIMFKESIING